MGGCEGGGGTPRAQTAGPRRGRGAGDKTGRSLNRPNKVMDIAPGRTLREQWPQMQHAERHRVVQAMQRLLDKAAGEGWRVTDNHAGNYIWDGSRLTRIDFDTTHVKYEPNTPAQKLSADAYDEAKRLFDIEFEGEDGDGRAFSSRAVADGREGAPKRRRQQLDRGNVGQHPSKRRRVAARADEDSSGRADGRRARESGTEDTRAAGVRERTAPTRRRTRSGGGGAGDDAEHGCEGDGKEGGRDDKQSDWAVVATATGEAVQTAAPAEPAGAVRRVTKAAVPGSDEDDDSEAELAGAEDSETGVVIVRAVGQVEAPEMPNVEARGVVEAKGPAGGRAKSRRRHQKRKARVRGTQHNQTKSARSARKRARRGVE